MHAVPENALAAATHPDPYAFYAALVSEKPLYYDETIQHWIASNAEAVNAVLANDLCRVRPAAQPIPFALVDSSAGKIFGALVRMTDGQGHCPLKKAVSSTLDRLDSATVYETSLRHAQILTIETSSNLTEFAFNLPAYVVADLLGVPQHHLASVAAWISDFVRCLSPISTPEQIEQGKLAADQLFDLFTGLLIEQQAKDSSTLLVYLSQTLSQQGISDNTFAIANAIGFISQSYEATAGLIGNALVWLATQPDLYEQITADLSLLDRFVMEVARFDSPVQNTRRFLATDAVIAGQSMKTGDCILVLLAAANRDPVTNPQPDRFDLHRQNPVCFTFGAGKHACPGQDMAQAITSAALHHLITAGLDITSFPKIVSYRPSANTRIPLFA